jgi:MFS family permease
VTEPPAKASIWSGPLLPVTVANLTIVALAAFDGLAVTAALSGIAEDLGDVALLPWVVTAYLAASSIAVIVAGPVIDAVGVRRTFRYTGVWFLLTSAACAVAPTLPLLVVARTAQGFGGGLVIAVALASVGLAYPPSLRPRALAANALVWGVLGLGGPALAAIFLEFSSWRLIFAVQIPLTAIALAAGWNSLPSTRERAQMPRADVRGILIIAGVTVVSLLGIAQVGDSWAIAGLSALLTIALLYAYWVHAGRTAEPVVLRRHLQSEPLRHVHLIAALVLAAVLSVDSYLPLYLNVFEGWSIGAAAFAVIFLTFGWTGGSLIASRWLDVAREEKVILAGSVGVVIGLSGGLLVLALGLPVWALLGLYVIAGLGVGMASTAGLTLVQAPTAPEEMGRVNSAHQYVRTLGITYGVAIGGAVLLSVVDLRIGDVEVVRDLLAGEDVALGEETRDAVAAGFTWAHVVAVALSLGALALALDLWRRRGRSAPRTGFPDKAMPSSSSP